MKIYYSTEKNTLILISLLKQHGIKKIIASPGTTNVSFVASVQNDTFFEVYSAVDERSAAFMACGLAKESGEPVVIICTGATASRDYIPGLTEAYKERIPVLAVTAAQHSGRIGNGVAQVIDRTEHFADMVKKSFHLPAIACLEDEESTITKVNDAILELTHREKGPIHINLETTYSNDFSVKKLPMYRKISRICIYDKFPQINDTWKIGILIGAHQVFTKKQEDLISCFCKKHNAIVLCDQTSNYRGNYRVLANLLNNQSVAFPSKHFDLIINIGYTSASYLNFSANQIWRINPDGEIYDTYYRLTYVFEMKEEEFFIKYCEGEDKSDLFINQCKILRKKMLDRIPELPFSNIWVASQTASLIPDNSVLHLGILNTIRSYNFFETPDAVSCYCNTGGFGIDGCVSSLIGAALVNPNKEYYGIVGDLAFFYDQNVLINELPKNLHIMIINNGVGTEFKNYNHRCAYFGNDADSFMAAKGHNGYKSISLVKNFSNNIGVKYFSANSKEEYLSVRDNWLKKTGEPVILEIFTNDNDESEALKIMNNLAIDKKQKYIRLIKRMRICQMGKRFLSK